MMDLVTKLGQFLIFGIALTWGQQTTPDGCLQMFPNSVVSCLKPYETRIGITDQQCRDGCTQNPSTCKAVEYNPNSRTCRMFQQTVDGQPRHGCMGSHSHEGHRPGGHPGMGPPPRGPSRPPPPGPPPRGPPPRGWRRKRGGNHGGHGCGQCTPALKTCNGYTYYKNTGQCNGGFTVVTIATTTGTVPIPDGANCPAGQLVRYYIVDGYQLSGTPDATFTATSEQSCIDACTNNRLPDGRQVPCKLFDFDTTSSTCSISFAGTGVAQTTPNPQIKHYEKTCVDSTFGNRCPGPYFHGPQKILVGFAQSVAGVSSAEECLQLCANSQSRFGFVCQSIVYYSQETANNCILNSETRLNHPDLYVPETADKVDYYEIGCTTVRAAIFQKVKRNRNVLVPNSNDFSGWTMCDQKVLDHRRYRRCKGMNPNKCELDKSQCDPAKEDDYDLPELTITTFPPTDDNCQPMIKPNGSKDCDNGTRRTNNGKHERCKPSKC